MERRTRVDDQRLAVELHQARSAVAFKKLETFK